MKEKIRKIKFRVKKAQAIFTNYLTIRIMLNVAVGIHYLMIKKGKLVSCFSVVLVWFDLLLKSTDYEMVI